jgi:hypothetical protein
MILHQNTPKSTSKSTPIYAGARVVGRVTGETFYKTIRKGWYLEKPPAIAFDISSLDDAEGAGADRVDIWDKETGKHYRATIALIRSAGLPVNRRYGAQIGLPLSYFSIDGQPPRNTPPTPSRETKTEQYRLL